MTKVEVYMGKALENTVKTTHIARSDRCFIPLYWAGSEY